MAPEPDKLQSHVALELFILDWLAHGLLRGLKWQLLCNTLRSRLPSRGSPVLYRRWPAEDTRAMRRPAAPGGAGAWLPPIFATTSGLAEAILFLSGSQPGAIFPSPQETCNNARRPMGLSQLSWGGSQPPLSVPRAGESRRQSRRDSLRADRSSRPWG